MEISNACAGEQPEASRRIESPDELIDELLYDERRAAEVIVDTSAAHRDRSAAKLTPSGSRSTRRPLISTCMSAGTFLEASDRGVQRETESARPPAVDDLIDAIRLRLSSTTAACSGRRTGLRQGLWPSRQTQLRRLLCRRLAKVPRATLFKGNDFARRIDQRSLIERAIRSSAEQSALERTVQVADPDSVDLLFGLSMKRS